MPTRVVFDTTTLSGAFLRPSPDGLCMALLLMARIGVIEPIITQEVVMEWRRIASEGRLDGIRYPDEILDEFVDLLDPLLANERLKPLQAGRVQVPLYPLLEKAGIRIVTQHPTHSAKIGLHMRGKRTLVMKDPFDTHLVEAALTYGVHYLCTSNTKDFPDGIQIGPFICVTPESLMKRLRGA